MRVQLRVNCIKSSPKCHVLLLIQHIHFFLRALYRFCKRPFKKTVVCRSMYTLAVRKALIIIPEIC